MTDTALVWVYGLDGKQAGVLADPRGLQIEERLQESETLTFNVRADDPKAYLIGPDRMVRYDGRRYRITDLKDKREGAQVTTEVVAEGLWIDLLGTWVRQGFTIVGQPIAAGLAALLAGTGWTVGTVESDGGTYSRSVDNDETVLASVRFWASLTGREIRWDTDTRTVSLVVQQGTDRGLGFRWGRNLTNVTRTTLPPECTRLYPYGANDLSIRPVNPTGKEYLEDFSYYTAKGLTLAQAQANYTRSQIWRDDRYLLATNLLDAATERLAKLAQPRVAYECSVVDLSGLTGSLEVFAIGDTVRVADDPLGVSLTTRIVRRITTPLEPAKNAVELSFLAPGLGGAASNGGTGGGTGQFALLVDQNLAALTLTAGLYALHGIELSFSSTGNLVMGLELDGTATGSGTLEVTYYWGSDQVGPTVQQAFTAGPFHLSVPDSLVGLEGSHAVYVRARVVTGSGTIAIPANASRFYILAAGTVGGGVNTDPEVSVNDTAYPFLIANADHATGVTATPELSGPTETVTTTPATPTETVTTTLY